MAVPDASNPSAPHTTVSVKIEVGAPNDPMWQASRGGIHGGDEGPARLLSLTRGPNGEWEARIVLHQGLRSEDLHIVLQHELNEVAGILSRHPSATPTDIQRETSAGVFRRDGVTETPTAHDQAAARELTALHNELEDQRGLHRPNADTIADKQARLDRMMRAMGLDDPTTITPAQRTALTEAGVPPELLKDIASGGAATRHTKNLQRPITAFDEALPMMSASGGATAAGHARSKHWENPSARAIALDMLNNPERVFTGVYTASGRQVDIYYRNGSVVITDAGQKGRVVTSYGPAFENGSKPLDPAQWAGDPNYREVRMR
jgi:hypothetical protein